MLSQEEVSGGGIAVRVVLRAEVRSCPRCGRVTGKLHDREEQAKGDVSLGGRRLVLILVKRRFRCPFCKKVFTEPDEMCGWRRRLTRRFREELYQEARHSTVKQVAEARGVSQDTVTRSLAEGAQAQRAEMELVRYLGMDDFSVRKGQRHQTAFYDLGQRKMLSVIEDRTEEILAYFEFGLINAFAERKNTRTKHIQRQAYGYRNLDNLNLRILLPCA